MECDICGRSPSAKLAFHCPTCARTALYALRIEQATIALEKESMGRKVEAVVTNGATAPRENISLSGAIIDTAECGKTYEAERMQAETASLEERVGLIAERAQKLRDEMEEHRANIAKMKARIRQRKSDAESAKYKLEERSAKELEVVQSAIRRRNRNWGMDHDVFVADRRFFCTTAAKVAGLKRGKKTEGGRKFEVFVIGSHTPIFDLRDLNGASPHILTSSLTQLAYLAVRISTYLAVRLPAEITLPHRDYPLPTIFSPSSSYLEKDIPFPGYTPSHSSHNSPAGSKTLDSRPPPKPRPLFVYDELPKLAKKDISAFNTFIEGVTLLAWDIAWLCKTQGLSGRDGFSSWTDVCPIGKNLWQLLLAEPKPANSRRSSSSRQSDARASVAGDSDARSSSMPAHFGRFSHGTAHSFLGGAEAAATMQDWKQSPVRVIDKVKAHLLAEMQGAEWEVVQQEGWDDAEAEEPVLVGGTRWTAAGSIAPPAKRSQAAPSSLLRKAQGNASLLAANAGSVDGARSDREQAAGSKMQESGWMQVRPRSGSSAKPDEQRK